MTKTFALSAVLVMAIAACSAADDPQAVVESYFSAWNTRNIDDIMEYVADDAALELDELGIMREGKEDIRAGFEAMFSRSEWTIEVSDLETQGNRVNYNYVILGPSGEELEKGRSEATIEDGKIVSEELIGEYIEPSS